MSTLSDQETTEENSQTQSVPLKLYPPMELTETFIYTGPDEALSYTGKACLLITGDIVKGNNSKVGIHPVRVDAYAPENNEEGSLSKISTCLFLVDKKHLKPIPQPLKEPHPASKHRPAAAGHSASTSAPAQSSALE